MLCGFMSDMILAWRALMAFPRSLSAAASFFLNAVGVSRAPARKAVLAIRETIGSGSRQSGGEVAA